MPFWTVFWLIVPAAALLAFTTIFYIRTGNKPLPKAPTSERIAASAKKSAASKRRKQGKPIR